MTIDVMWLSMYLTDRLGSHNVSWLALASDPLDAYVWGEAFERGPDDASPDPDQVRRLMTAYEAWNIAIKKTDEWGVRRWFNDWNELLGAAPLDAIRADRHEQVIEAASAAEPEPEPHTDKAWRIDHDASLERWLRSEVAQGLGQTPSQGTSVEDPGTHRAENAETNKKPESPEDNR
ncbi:hypothetical protein ACFQ9V_08775 [Leifsonia sp. NPDC056665]|uniref:hypothetical protein n=1 Tax=Leifsonia sp. NPDC056665 TaxID=3345901 RepID=UPI0036D0B154